ncbi:MAG: NnrS family protein [Aquabacterium sp.]|nr:NnrS family protein [Aquabacterium sp.]
MAAPHRLSFFTATCVMSAAAAWWWVEMLARSGAWPSLEMAVPPTFVHAVVMSLGFMPLFFSGFLFTAGPKWLQMGEVQARAIAPGVFTTGAGWLALLCGSLVSHGLASAGVALAAIGWAMLTWRFLGLVRRSPARDRLHAKLIAVACSLGVLVMLSAAVCLVLGDYRIIRLAALLGLWWFIVPVYVTVAHRMIPFFTASALPVLDAWRPNWLLWTLLGLVGVQGCWLVLEELGWQGPVWLGLRAVASSASGALVIGLAVRWGLVQSLRIRLLAMLHIGFVWLGLAFCLDAASVILGAVGQVQLSLLPLHALTMGFLGSVLIAMVTRVSCGHSGRTLTADNLAWGLFWGLQVAVLLRMSAVLWSASSPALLVGAASAWLLVMGAWSLRYGRWYGQPRVDGRPG